MSQLKQVLRMLAQGEAFKRIERDTGISRTTIKRYHRLIHTRALNVDELVLREDPELLHLLQTRKGLHLQSMPFRKQEWV